MKRNWIWAAVSLLALSATGLRAESPKYTLADNEKEAAKPKYLDEDANPVVNKEKQKVAKDDCDSCDACDTGTCGSQLFAGFDRFCCLGDPLKLVPDDPHRLFNIGGHVQIGYHTEGTNGFGTGLFNNYPNRVQLHQAWVHAEKVAQSDGCCLDWGFRVDYVFGTDGPDTQAFGEPVPPAADHWDNAWDHGGAYGHAIPQLYGEVTYGDWRVKGGHFFTIVGYEVVPATGNFFYSHSYSMTLTEPFTHTGVLAEWSVNDRLTIQGGWTLGWDTGFSGYGGDIFLGGATMQLSDELSLAYAVTAGDFGTGGGNDGYSHSIVVDWQVNDRIEYVLQSDYISNPNFVGGGGEIVSLNNYAFYKINDCWKFGVRAEWWDNQGLPDELGEITAGLNFRPHANLVVRPEVRWDWFEDGLENNLGLRDQTVFGVDAVLTF